jgi:hypothetical protein
LRETQPHALLCEDATKFRAPRRSIKQKAPSPAPVHTIKKTKQSKPS